MEVEGPGPLSCVWTTAETKPLEISWLSGACGSSDSAGIGFGLAGVFGFGFGPEEVLVVSGIVRVAGAQAVVVAPEKASPLPGAVLKPSNAIATTVSGVENVVGLPGVVRGRARPPVSRG